MHVKLQVERNNRTFIMFQFITIENLLNFKNRTAKFTNHHFYNPREKKRNKNKTHIFLINHLYKGSIKTCTTANSILYKYIIYYCYLLN